MTRSKKTLSVIVTMNRQYFVKDTRLDVLFTENLYLIIGYTLIIILSVLTLYDVKVELTSLNRCNSQTSALLEFDLMTLSFLVQFAINSEGGARNYRGRRTLI